MSYLQVVTAIKALRGKAALNWVFKVVDIIVKAPLSDQLEHYSTVHEKRTERIMAILESSKTVEEKVEPMQQQLNRIENQLEVVTAELVKLKGVSGETSK